MILNKSFIDSNIIIYLFDSNSYKKDIALPLLANTPTINSQVLVEVGNICKKKLGFTKEDVLNIWNDLLNDCDVVPLDSSTFQLAISLIKRYKFQLFDSLIVASALQANCIILFSEDMHHELLVEGKLRIINPFKI